MVSFVWLSTAILLLSLNPSFAYRHIRQRYLQLGPDSAARKLDGKSNDKVKSSKAPTDSVKSSKTPTDKAKSSKAPTDSAKSSKAPTNSAKSSKAPTDKAKAGKAQTGSGKSSKAPTDSAKISKAPTDSAKSSKAPKDSKKGAKGASASLADSSLATSDAASDVQNLVTEESSNAAADDIKAASAVVGNPGDLVVSDIERFQFETQVPTYARSSVSLSGQLTTILGGVDDMRVELLRGAYKLEFNLPADGRVCIRFRYHMYARTDTAIGDPIRVSLDLRLEEAGDGAVISTSTLSSSEHPNGGGVEVLDDGQYVDRMMLRAGNYFLYLGSNLSVKESISETLTSSFDDFKIRYI